MIIFYKMELFVHWYRKWPLDRIMLESLPSVSFWVIWSSLWALMLHHHGMKPLREETGRSWHFSHPPQGIGSLLFSLHLATRSLPISFTAEKQSRWGKNFQILDWRHGNMAMWIGSWLSIWAQHFLHRPNIRIWLNFVMCQTCTDHLSCARC